MQVRRFFHRTIPVSQPKGTFVVVRENVHRYVLVFAHVFLTCYLLLCRRKLPGQEVCYSLFGKVGQWTKSKFYLVSGWFSIWKIVFQDRNWFWETTWFWIARWDNNWLSYVSCSVLNLTFGYSTATVVWHIPFIQDFWENFSFFIMQVCFLY